MPRKNAAVCCAVHTATAGRWPVARQAATRAPVQTTGCGRRTCGNWTQRAGLSAMTCSRTAAFSAERSVAWIRTSVAAETGCAAAACWRWIAVNMACKSAGVSDCSGIRPRCGTR